MGGEERVARQHAQRAAHRRASASTALLDDGHASTRPARSRASATTATTASSTDFLPANMVVGQGRIDGRRVVAPGRRLHRPRRRRRRGDLAEDGLGRARRPRAAPAARAPRRRHRRRRQRQVARDDGLHLRAAAARASSWWSRTSRACRSSRRRSGPCAGLGAARVVAQPLQRDRPRHRAALRRRPAGRGGGDGRVARQGGSSAARAPRRAPGAVDNEAADEDDALEQLRRFLSYLPRSVVGGAAGRRADRPARPPRGGAALDRPARRAPALQDAPHPRARRSTAARCSRSARASARSLITALARLDGPPGRRARLRPQALRRRPHRRRVGQARALRRHLRPVPPAGRQLRRPARLRDRHRGRARGHDPPRRAARCAAVLPGDACRGCSVLVRKVYGVAGAGHGDGSRLNLRYAWPVGRLGLAADRGRHRGRLPARARGRRRPGGAARRDRGAPERRALPVPHRRALHASRRSSTRATRGRCSATGPSARTSSSRSTPTTGPSRAAPGPDHPAQPGRRVAPTR